jgi:hypothetical protein
MTHDTLPTEAQDVSRCFKECCNVRCPCVVRFLILGIPGTSLCLAGGKALAHHRCDKFFGNLLVQKGKRTSVYSHYTLVTLSACSAERSFSDPVLLLACLASQTFQHHKGKTWFKNGNMYQHVLKDALDRSKVKGSPPAH